MAFWRATLVLIVIMLFCAVAMPMGFVARRLNLGLPHAPLRWGCRAVLWLLGVRVRHHGFARRSKAALLVANHVSWMDILAVLSVEPVCFLAKQEVASWPLISRLAQMQGTLFVDRSRRRLIPKVNQAMARCLIQGGSVLFFPEGTTFDGMRLGKFHTSHLACMRDVLLAAPEGLGPDVQPIAIRYSDPVAAWIGDATLLPHIWAVLKAPRLTCHLRYGEAQSFRENQDRKALGRRLTSEIEAVLAALPPVAGGAQLAPEPCSSPVPMPAPATS